MSEWISVKDELPNEDGDYICARRGYSEPEIVSFQCSEENRANWNDVVNYPIGGYSWFKQTDEQKENRKTYGNVTHWMPLPELPTKQGKS